MINFDIKTTNIEMTDAISNFLGKRLKKLEKFVPQDDSSAMGQVEIGVTTRGQQSGDIFRCEINLHFAGAQFRNVAETGDLYSAISEARDQTITDVQRHREKKETLYRRGARSIKKIMRFGYRNRKIPK